MKTTRKSRLTPETYRKLLESLSQGLSCRQAAKQAHCHFNTAALLKKKMKAHVEIDILNFAKTFKVPKKLAAKLYCGIFFGAKLKK